MNKNDYIIRNEVESDYRAVEELTRESFWNVYVPGASEHYYAHTMRTHEDFIPELAFVMEHDGHIIGNVMHYRTTLTDEEGNIKPVLSFGPICIHPEFQRRGLSRLLLEHSFEKAVQMGYDTVVIFGNPANYVGRGFVSCRKKNVCLEGGFYPTSLLVKELKQNALDGRKYFFRDSNASEVCEDTAAVERFDSTFAPKEKKWMPSQEEFFIYSHSAVVRE